MNKINKQQVYIVQQQEIQPVFCLFFFFFGCTESLLLLELFSNDSEQGLLFLVVLRLLIAVTSLVTHRL